MCALTMLDLNGRELPQRESDSFSLLKEPAAT